MSLKNAVVAINETQQDFLAINTSNLNFKKECEFAIQLLEGNEALLKAATANPNSLKNAIVNVSAIGLSLNPVEKLAHLVPRGNKVCLDDSYMGKMKIATDSGSVKWVNVELVCEKDTFKYIGAGLRPVHDFDPFGDRGAAKGVYCIAETHDGSILMEMMNKSEIYAIRDKTQAYMSYVSGGKKGSCIWVDHEMAQWKKTVIRRGSKFWPKTDRLLKALTLNIENSDFDQPIYKRDAAPVDPTVLAEIKEILERNHGWEQRLLEHLTNKTNGKNTFKSINELNAKESEYALHVLREQDAKEKEIQVKDT